MNVNVKVGRPLKPKELKEEVKSKYNKDYYQNTTKVLSQIAKEFEKNKTVLTQKQYRKELVDFFSKYDFNYFFSGTSSSSYLQKEELKILNKPIKELNKELGCNLTLHTHKELTINQLVRYTNKYVDYLIDKKVVDKALIFFEQNKNKEWHTHILFSITDKNLIDVNSIIENSWLSGISLNVPIPTKQDLTEILNYSTKQLTSRYDKKGLKNLHWNLKGNYEMNKEIKREYTKEERLQFIKEYKIKNNLFIYLDEAYHENQKRLNDKHFRNSA